MKMSRMEQDFDKLWARYKEPGIVIKVKRMPNDKINSKRVKYYKDGKLLFHGYKLDGKWHWKVKHVLEDGSHVSEVFDRGRKLPEYEETGELEIDFIGKLFHGHLLKEDLI